MAPQPRELASVDTLDTPLKLACGLTLPNRLIKCPMQETLAKAPTYDPPIDTFANLYTKWARANYGLIITGQVQVDIRFLSVLGDVVIHEHSLEAPYIDAWKRWASISKAGGTPCVVQLAHPGRMSPTGAGVRPADMPTMCPSSIPVKLGDTWLDKLALDKVLGTPRAMTLEEIDNVVELFKHAARVAHTAGFDGIQLHGAHGFLLSQFLSPHTNRRTDDYGGTPEKRMALLKRLVTAIRSEHPAPLCLGVKLNSADYMDAGQGLQQDEGLEQVRWLATCGMVDFVEVSGGNAENKTSGLHQSFGRKTLDRAPKEESTRIRESFFTEFAEKAQAMQSPVPIQLSGGFRSRNGMADAIESGLCQLIGLGRSAVLEPESPREIILNREIADDDAFARSHIVRGQWLAKLMPLQILGSSLSIQFFYHNMRRLGKGLASDPDMSIPKVILMDTLETLRAGLTTTLSRILQSLSVYRRPQKIE
ncbi:hypothetical protein LTR36_006300 [Oleoguttula mirabilis]|uniref:NADH:flavin oxidoreductase/NADH oxidase N-terminal domain-containing protein n=1 Tax=Oleoguttula mirabilis TaxID=1507867 RepID=A0AAV9JCB4_9PEZI|nr:hypothetical protein LTR36_006300 [Oleoguttula mirabilis]